MREPATQPPAKPPALSTAEPAAHPVAQPAAQPVVREQCSSLQIRLLRCRHLFLIGTVSLEGIQSGQFGGTRTRMSEEDT